MIRNNPDPDPVPEDLVDKVKKALDEEWEKRNG